MVRGVPHQWLLGCWRHIAGLILHTCIEPHNCSGLVADKWVYHRGAVQLLRTKTQLTLDRPFHTLEEPDPAGDPEEAGRHVMSHGYPAWMP